MNPPATLVDARTESEQPRPMSAFERAFASEYQRTLLTEKRSLAFDPANPFHRDAFAFLRRKVPAETSDSEVQRLVPGYLDSWSRWLQGEKSTRAQRSEAKQAEKRRRKRLHVPKSALLVALACLMTACGGPTASIPAEIDLRAVQDPETPQNAPTDLWQLRIGEDPNPLCWGEIDSVRGVWYCGHGGYTSIGGASMHGTVTVLAPGRFRLDSVSWWPWDAAPSDGVYVWQPAHVLNPPGARP